MKNRIKRNRHILFFLLIVAILSILIWVALNFFTGDDEAIHIAFVGPLSGEYTITGKSMLQAIQLYLDGVNDSKEITEKKIILDTFDDQNNPSLALKMAREIIGQDQAVAVIGHNHSSGSIRASTVYKQHAIAAISPASTNVQLTEDNDWYFRTVFDDNLQGRYLASYAKYILKHDTVSIIYTDIAYGSYLAGVFEENFQNLFEKTVQNENTSENQGIKYKWDIAPSENLEQRITEVVNALKTKPDAGLIFLATHAHEGVKLVKAIKDAGIENPLMAPDSYASHNFSQGFKKYPKEQNISGYYTNGIHVSTPFLLDTANKYAHDFNSKYEKKYQEQLPWQAFNAVDAAILIVKAIKQAGIQGQPETLVEDREKIRDILANITTLEQAVEGTTGLNYFDKNGNAFKAISMGIYKNNKLLISVFNQLQIVGPSKKTDDDKIESERIKRIKVGEDHYLRKTDVVYTGVQFNEISDLDLDSVTYNLDFYLWFRFKKHIKLIKPPEIKFLNSVKPIKLGKYIVDDKIHGWTYRLYRVQGRFKENIYLPKPPAFFTQHLLGVSFHHNELTKNNLIYVTDSWGMDFTNEPALLAEFQERQIFTPVKDWTVRKINFFRTTFKQKRQGNPKYLKPGKIAEYSTFNANILIGNNDYFYHKIIPEEFTLDFFIFSSIMTLLFIFINYTNIYRQYFKYLQYLKYLWFTQVIFAFSLLLSIEILVARSLPKGVSQDEVNIILIVFDILWWIVPAILINTAIKNFFWTPLVERTGRSVPEIMRFLISFVIYLLAFFGIIAFVFELPVTSLLATSGIVAGIIGFAMQTSLANILSGIALNIDRSFRVGDWVKIGDFEEGKVVDMTWRVTQVQTRSQYLLNIPNNMVSHSDVHNFSYPSNQYWLKCIVHLDPKHDPRKVEEVLRRAMQAAETKIVEDVEPMIWFKGIDVKDVSEGVASYVVFFKTEDYQYKFRVLKNVWRHIWVHLNQAGMITDDMTQPYEAENVAAEETQLTEVLTKSNLQNMITGSSPS